MRITRLKHSLLLGAVAICVLMAVAFTVAVSWVIRQQHLDQSNALLQKAAKVVEDSLDQRRRSLLAASRQLATQRNMGSTIWYLAQYSASDLDRETLVNTYQQLVRDVHRIAHVANATRIALYDYSGNLVAYSSFDGGKEQAGFVEYTPAPSFHVAMLDDGEEFSQGKVRSENSVANMAVNFGGPLPTRESTRYSVAGGVVSIRSEVPIVDEMFDQSSGMRKPRQVGLVAMEQSLDQTFVDQLSRLTDTGVNVFTPQGFASGSVANYRAVDWGGATPAATRTPVLNEIAIDGTGYYQGLMPLFAGNELTGTISILHSKAIVEKSIWEMIRTLSLIAAASLLFITPFAWYVAASISRPLTVLSRIFRSVANDEQSGAPSRELGELEGESRRHDELGDLTQSFIAMHRAVNQKIQQINDINASLEHTVEERTAALAAKERESRSLIENSPDTIARYDRECRRIYVNPAFGAMVEGGVATLLGKKPSESPNGPNAEIYEQKINEVFATGRDAQFELKWAGKDDKEMCSHIRLTPESDASGRIVTVLGIGRDISERMAFETMIWRQANFDMLTQLPNRQMFQDRLAQEAKISHRSGLPMVLMLLDLDRFKEVNDTLGHDKGDMLLVEAARRIGACVRESDTVARLGGDEFTVILSNMDDMRHVERIAQDIIDKLAAPFKLGAEEVYISASIGISIHPTDTENLDELFKNADQAMYAAKNAGRGRFSYFTADMQTVARERLLLTNGLRAALIHDEFRVYYQPIVELASGRIHKAEALVRWHHPERSLLGPENFIALAEDTGLIVPIGDWVFKEAVRQAIRWRATLDASFQISVNKSPTQIRQRGNESLSWADYLKREGLPGQAIAVEITEGPLLDEESRIEEELSALRAAGMRVSIDDFGTGHSSLADLVKSHVDYIKIDRAFVRHLGPNTTELALCQAIIAMAHTLGVKVIAEGVETHSQHDLLATTGCDYAQGVLYSKPVAPEEFEKLSLLG